jgi:ABC-type polysaccharide/polyol phosphate transport system ATPase subunit
MYSVIIDDVSKYYRKYSKLKNFNTLKGAILRDLWRKDDTQDDKLFWALRNVSLNIKSGATTGIIGANGAGKSTLLKVITGLTKPNSGTVKTEGRISALIELGTGFHPEISGRENIFVNGIMLGLTKKQIRDKYDEIVEFAELGDFIEYPIKTYSTGMLMRLGFTVAVNVDPDILIIDEVLAVGDMAFSRKCLDRITDFKKRGKTIILVTHDLTMVRLICDEAIWLDMGRTMERGEVPKVIDGYMSQVVEKQEAYLKALQKKSHDVIKEGDVAKTELPSLDDVQSELEEDETSKESVQHTRLTHDPRIYDKTKPARWGSREIEIDSVVFKNLHGDERIIFACGEPMIAEIKFKVNQAIDEPVFGCGIMKADGTCCYGTNTRIEDILIPRIERDGTLRIVFEELNLLGGTYYFDVAIHGMTGYNYDYQSMMHSFRINTNYTDLGIFRPPHTWEFEGGYELNKSSPLG